MAKLRLIGIFRTKNKKNEKKPVYFPKVSLEKLDSLKTEREKKARKSYYTYRKELYVRPEFLYRIKHILTHKSINVLIFQKYLGIYNIDKRERLSLKDYCIIQNFLTGIIEEIKELPVRPRTKQDFYIIRKTIGKYFSIVDTFPEDAYLVISGQRSNFDSPQFLIPYQRTIDDLIRDLKLNYIDRCQYVVKKN